MKVRIISGLVCLVILAAVLFAYETIALEIAVTLIVLMAVWELLNAAGLAKKHRFLTIICEIGGVVICLFGNRSFALTAAGYGMAVLLFFYLLRHHEIIRVEEVGFAFLISFFVPLSFGCVLYSKAQWGAQVSLFYLMLILGSAWWADTGAYFTGVFFGKHKLCPKISPKKTIEGFIGGIITAILGNLLMCVLFSQYFQFHFGADTVVIHYTKVILFTPFWSVLGVLGDLSASIIKRQFGIKDYGKLIPGHGGIMDRFDSVLYICPIVYLFANILPLVSFI